MATSKGRSCCIAPSILNADLSNLASECQRFLEAGADYLHLDVMDGHFVPNLTFGHPVVKCLRQNLPSAYFEMHMMVAEPERWVEEVADAGANMYSFHYEATPKPEDCKRCIRKIKEAGMKVGLGVNPKTAITDVEEFVESVDLMLIMTVEPGFGGQSFMADMLPKITYLRDKFRSVDIEVDGGVGPKTIHQCAEAGANVIVSGSALVKSADPKTTISEMRQVVNNVLQRGTVER